MIESTGQVSGTLPGVLVLSLDGIFLDTESEAHAWTTLAPLLESLVHRGLMLVYASRCAWGEAAGKSEMLNLPPPSWWICGASAEILRQRPDGSYRPDELCRAERSAANAALPAPSGLADVAGDPVSRALWRWAGAHAGGRAEQVVFAGSSDADAAVCKAGYRTIFLYEIARRQAKDVLEHHRAVGWYDRFYLARSTGADGLKQGCRWFGLLPSVRYFIDSDSAGEDNAFPLGATAVNYRETHFRVWAPRRKSVAVEFYSNSRNDAGDKKLTSQRRVNLTRKIRGYFEGAVDAAGPGTYYRYVLDGQISRPDPASRLQEGGVHGPSRVVDAQCYPWTDETWRGVSKRDLLIYETHIGAWTEQGTLQSAIERLAHVRRLGATAVELMPVAQSPGRWNWGYDGVNMFAVRNTYGGPHQLKAFVDACHAAGLAVILDVVYNHLGPEGNYLADFGPYFSGKHRTPWGEAFNYDGSKSQPVRQFILDNALYWIQEYHLDGLRLDAAHFMFDDRPRSILQQLKHVCTEYGKSAGRTIHLIAETNVYDSHVLTPTSGAPGCDAIWSDCLMHALYSHAVPDMRLTPRDYRGAADVHEALRHGCLYEGAEPIRVEQGDTPHCSVAHRASLVTGLQTHDSVGNHPHGTRLHQLAGLDYQMSAAALVLMLPGIPLIFMGEETACDAPFPFFVDFGDPGLRRAVDRGRAREYPQHSGQGAGAPSDPRTFHSAQFHVPAECEMFDWYQQLIALRRQGLAEGWLDAKWFSTASAVSDAVFRIEYRQADGPWVFVQSQLRRASETNGANSGMAALLELLPLPTSNTPRIVLQSKFAIAGFIPESR